MPPPEAQFHTIPINGTDEDWKFSVTPAACVTLEKITNTPILKYARQLSDPNPMLSRDYDLAFGLSASWRAKRFPHLTFEDCLDLWPAPGADDWPKWRQMLYDLMCKCFFGHTWEEQIQMLEVLAQAARREIQEDADARERARKEIIKGRRGRKRERRRERLRAGLRAIPEGTGTGMGMETREMSSEGITAMVGMAQMTIPER